MDNRCVICGKYVPEGRQICYECEWNYSKEKPCEMTAREFIEIWNRLCKSYITSPCEKCPVYKWCMGPPQIAEYKEMETALVEWAKEHPRKKCKTYAEDFLEKFPNTCTQKINKDKRYPIMTCRQTVYQGDPGCPRFRVGDISERMCFDCWNEEMENENE